MKKLLVLTLALGLMFAFSFIGLAEDVGTDCCPPQDPPPVQDEELCGDSVYMKVQINDYCNAKFKTSEVEWAGLFGYGEDLDIGAPGVYISDGMVTVNDVMGTNSEDGLWTGVLAEAPDDYDYDFRKLFLPTENEGSELFSIDANTKVEVTLSSTWDGWLDAPTLLMVYSVDNWSDPLPPNITDQTWNGISLISGEWHQFAHIANTVNSPYNQEYTAMIEAHNEIVDSPAFLLDFPKDYLCHGPLDFIITGALLIPKISQVAAGNYESTVSITVTAVDES